MIAVVQRVTQASVLVEELSHHESIQQGLCVLLGVEQGDTPSHASWMAKKIANLRIFNDIEGKMNRSVIDVQGEILLISQFTLAGDCNQGNRPSFINAAEPSVAEPLIEVAAQELSDQHSVPVKQGVFGAMMKVNIVNDGPVTLVLQRA